MERLPSQHRIIHIILRIQLFFKPAKYGGVAPLDDYRHLYWTMRYQPEHKAEIHQKIVKDASRRVRAEGLTGAAVSAVMRDAGLTHGGFYKHFESKDALLIESLGESFRDIADHLVHAAEQS